MDFLISATDRASRVFTKVANSARKLSHVVDGMKLANVAAMRTALVSLGAQAAPVILALGAALAKVGPAALIAAPALAALVASLAAVKLATHGVKDAFAAAASGDAKEFAEALKKLSPAARRFVRDGAKMIPALRAMRTAIQETLFAKIPAGTLAGIAKNLLPTLRRGLVGVSSSLGTAAAQLAAFMKSGRARGDLAATFAGITAALRPLERVPATLAKAFGRLSATAAPFLVKLTSGIGRGLDSMASRIDKAAASGKLTAMIQSALDTLSQLGRIAGNVGRALGGLFRASENNSLIDTIERITKAIADAVNSERGQQVIAKVLEVIAKAGPVVTVAAGLTWAITGIATALAAVASPAAAVAGVVIAVAAGFALLYNKSAALREIVAGVGGKLRELWDLFVAKGLPIIKDFAENALATAISGFNEIRDAIQRNKPELEQLWAGVKRISESVMSAWPGMATVAVTTLKLIFSGIRTVIDTIGIAVRAFNTFKQAVVLAVTGVLLAFSMILGGLAKFAGAMSRVPGMAGLWKPVVNAANNAKNAIDGITNAINGVPSSKTVRITVEQRTNTVTGLPRRGTIPERAAGGPVRAGQPYIVGERRPELFVPNQSGRIVPRVPGMSGGSAAGGGARSVNLTVHAVLDGHVVKDFIKKTVSIDGGGSVQAAFG
jgi:hypothetical protein